MITCLESAVTQLFRHITKETLNFHITGLCERNPTMISWVPSHRTSNAESTPMSSSHHVDGLVQERCNFIANALVLGLSCTTPSMWIRNMADLPMLDSFTWVLIIQMPKLCSMPAADNIAPWETRASANILIIVWNQVLCLRRNLARSCSSESVAVMYAIDIQQ